MNVIDYDLESRLYDRREISSDSGRHLASATVRANGCGGRESPCERDGRSVRCREKDRSRQQCRAALWAEERSYGNGKGDGYVFSSVTFV